MPFFVLFVFMSLDSYRGKIHPWLPHLYSDVALYKCCHGVLLRYPYTKCSSKSCVSTICSIYSVQLLLLCVFVFLTLWYQCRSHSGIFHKRAAQPVGTGRLIFPLPLHPVRTKDICIGLIVLAIFLGPGFVFVIPDRHGHLCVD
jgi:hypothetical protein